VDDSAVRSQELYRELVHDYPWALAGPGEAAIVQARLYAAVVREQQGEQLEAVDRDAAGVPPAEDRPAQNDEEVVAPRGQWASVIAREVAPSQRRVPQDARQSARQVQRALAVRQKRGAQRALEQASPQLLQDASARERRQVLERREAPQAREQASLQLLQDARAEEQPAFSAPLLRQLPSLRGRLQRQPRRPRRLLDDGEPSRQLRRRLNWSAFSSRPHQNPEAGR
jgi:hypothetical protein